MILYQDCSSHLDSSKNMAASGRGLFSLYIYIENFKNLLVRNHWTDFSIILQECFFDDLLPRLFRPFGFVKKHGRQGAGLTFPHIIIIIGFLINVQVQGQHPHQWAPFQIAGLLHAWQISHQISRYVYHEG